MEEGWAAQRVIQDELNIRWEEQRQGFEDLRTDHEVLRDDQCVQKAEESAIQAKLECYYQGLEDDTVYADIISTCATLYDDTLAAKKISYNCQ